MTVKYSIRSGFPFKKHRAEAYAKELERLAALQDDIPLSPHEVVEAAKDHASPLHDAFQWDDAMAAYQWRVEQARSLIASLYVTIERDHEERDVRAFFNVIDEEGEQGYVAYETAQKSEIYRQYILKQALMQLVIWRSKYADYKELLPVYAAIDQVAVMMENGTIGGN